MIREGDGIKNSSIKLGIAYSFIHFSVETACFYFIFSRFSTRPNWWAFALLFDALAFLPQNVIGIYSDRNLKKNIGLWGGVLMLISLFLQTDITALVLICIGNAMIHVSGAQYTLRGCSGKITPNAIFVGGGSFGVITGQLLGALSNEYIVIIPLMLMAVSVLLMARIPSKTDVLTRDTGLDVAKDMPPMALANLAFLAVAVRGYVAYAIPIEWNKTALQAIALFFFMGFGKMLGGILADRVGYRKTTYISLLGGLPFLLFGNGNMWVSLFGIMLFSMTMPITVAILVSAFPKMVGFAFGITTVGLFAGVFPAFFVQPKGLLAHQILVVVLIALALPAIDICIKKGK